MNSDSALTSEDNLLLTTFLACPSFSFPEEVMEWLNELVSNLADPALREEGWQKISEIAARVPEQRSTQREFLRITIFELAAEPPEIDYFLKLLFSLSSEPQSQWAVFAAFENYPWRLRPMAKRYGNGQISNGDVDKWLCKQGLGEDEFLMHTPSQ